jgi:hypothetical protein
MLSLKEHRFQIPPTVNRKEGARDPEVMNVQFCPGRWAEPAAKLAAFPQACLSPLSTHIFLPLLPQFP